MTTISDVMRYALEAHTAKLESLLDKIKSTQDESAAELLLPLYAAPPDFDALQAKLDTQ